MAFYLRPPGGNISLQKLTKYAETRLNFLCQVYLTNGDGMKLQDIVLATEAVEDSDCLIEGSLKDKISHFILRLAFIESKELRNFFQKAETILFDFRFSCLTKEELVKCFRSLEQHIRTVSSCCNLHIQQTLDLFMKLKEEFHGWKQLVHAYLSGDSSKVLRVPFQTVLQLVAHREVLLQGGIASVPVCRLRELVTSLFSQLLDAGFLDAGQEMMNSNEDVRMSKLFRNLQRMLYQKLGHQLSPQSVTWSLTHDDVDRHVPLFPPCMGQLHRSLRQHHRLNHHARIQYTLFLKEAGLPVHEALMFWKKEYSHSPNNNNGCCHSWAEDEKRYTYNIRHLYGLEGSRINYRGHSCKALQEMHVGPTCEGGCPFSHYDSSHLYTVLKSDDIENRHLEILDLTSQGRYSEACGVCLSEKLKQSWTSKHIDSSVSPLSHEDCENAPSATAKQALATSEVTEYPDSILHLGNVFCGVENEDSKGVTDKLFPIDETDTSSLGSDSPEHFHNSSVETNVSLETPKCLVILCKSAMSSPRLGVSNQRTSVTPSKIDPVPDLSQKPTQKRELLELTDEPHSFKVRKKESSSDTCASKEANERKQIIINKPIEYYLQLKDNG